MSSRKKIDEIKQQLEFTDLKMGRIIEDVIHLLVQRGFIKYSDLCDESREEIKNREELRDRLRALMEEESSIRQKVR